MFDISLVTSVTYILSLVTAGTYLLSLVTAGTYVEFRSFFKPKGPEQIKALRQRVPFCVDFRVEIF